MSKEAWAMTAGRSKQQATSIDDPTAAINASSAVDEFFVSHYVMSHVLEILAEFDFDDAAMDEFQEEHLLEVMNLSEVANYSLDYKE